MEVGLPSDVASATTQTLSNAISDHLQLVEERNDLLVGIALVDDLLAGLALFGGGDVGDLLGDGEVADALEVAHLELLDGLALGRHDPLEGRVAGLDDA